MTKKHYVWAVNHLRIMVDEGRSNGEIWEVFDAFLAYFSTFAPEPFDRERFIEEAKKAING